MAKGNYLTVQHYSIMICQLTVSTGCYSAILPNDQTHKKSNTIINHLMSNQMKCCRKIIRKKDNGNISFIRLRDRKSTRLLIRQLKYSEVIS